MDYYVDADYKRKDSNISFKSLSQVVDLMDTQGVEPEEKREIIEIVRELP